MHIFQHTARRFASLPRSGSIFHGTLFSFLSSLSIIYHLSFIYSCVPLSTGSIPVTLFSLTLSLRLLSTVEAS